LKNIGSAGKNGNRTYFDLSLTVGVTSSRQNVRASAVHPIPFPVGILNHLAPAKASLPNRKSKLHPFLLAQSWQHELKQDSSLNKAKIAAREGYSRARVTQIMNLLELPQVIQVDLLNPPPPLKINQFSERRLRSLIALADTVKQKVAWRSWVTDLMNQVPL
jgi:hypothetical protein